MLKQITISGQVVPWMRPLARLTARLFSLATSAVYLLIIFLAVTHEDGLPPPAPPVLALLGLTLVAGWAAWGWERVGGGLMMAWALSLGVVVYLSAAQSGFGAEAWLAPVIYSLPNLAVGALFVFSGLFWRRPGVR